MAKSAKKKGPWRKFFDEWVVTLGLAFAVAFFFRTTIASPRHIPTGSMIPTIKIGEFIFVGMFTYDWHIPFTRKSLVERGQPQHGDIVVFEYPLDPDKDYIKRVIAIPGDTVEVRDKRVILNGKPLELEPVKDQQILRDLEPKYNPELMSLFREKIADSSHYVVHMNDRISRDLEPTTVPPNSFFVMGDNRDDSQDSRYWGMVPREKLLGKAGFIWFSFDINHFPFLRFNRFFTMLR
ncbi:MAG: signal peptidase I [Deltaproteobacteria bacterium]|nr:signal peptidase I [Deltaproteobacteria bacterium]